MRRFITILFLMIIAAGLSYYAFFMNKEEVTISFNTNSEIKMKSLNIKGGESISLPTLEREGFEFLGWYNNDEKVDNNYKFNKNTTLDAKWKVIEKDAYTVTFNTVGGTPVPNQQTVNKGEKVTKPNNPTKEGYTFKEWQLNGQTYNFDTPVNSDMNLEALWEKSSTGEKKYTVTFVDDVICTNCSTPKQTNGSTSNCSGGSICTDHIYKTVEVAEGEKVTKPVDPKAEDGYKFKEWQLDGKAYDFNTPVTKDLRLVAKMEKSTTKKYTVTFVDDVICTNCSTPKQANGSTSNCSGGSICTDHIYKTVEVAEGEKVTKPVDPKAEDGYKFKEWQLDGKAYDFNTPVTKDLRLVAKMEKSTTKKYTVTFVDSEACTTCANGSTPNCSGGSVCVDHVYKKIEVAEGEKVPRPTDPTLSGYIFKEWQLNSKAYDFNTPVTKNITLKARWDKITTKVPYTITLIDEKGSLLTNKITIDYTCGTIITGMPTLTSTRIGKFVGWFDKNGKQYKNGDTMPCSNITLYAKWEGKVVNSYTVTFMSYPSVCPTCIGCNCDHYETYKVEQVKEGEKAIKPADPTRSGYKFSGWQQSDGKAYDFDTPVTSNLTLFSKWEMIKK